MFRESHSSKIKILSTNANDWAYSKHTIRTYSPVRKKWNFAKEKWEEFRWYREHGVGLHREKTHKLQVVGATVDTYARKYYGWATYSDNGLRGK